MKTATKIVVGALGAALLAAGIAFILLRLEYEAHKTACSRVTDADALATLRDAFQASLQHSKPETVSKLQFVPVVHRDSIYPPDDPNHSVKVFITDRTNGHPIRVMHLFGDCDIETWGIDERSGEPVALSNTILRHRSD